MPRTILLNPGPVTLSPRVRAALDAPDTCHREPEFAALTKRINAALLAVYPEFGNEFAAVTLTGSGTSAVEAMLGTFAPQSGGTLVLANGVYGERMARMLEVQGKPFRLLRREWTDGLEPGELAAALDAAPELTHVATVHHETTTGRLNDLAALGTLCREHGRKLLLDAVSSFGAEAIEPLAWNLEAVAATSNKCLHAAPGISFVMARQSAWQREAGPPHSVYLDLRAYYAGQQADGYSPFTQAVPAAFALEAALDELREAGGWPVRRETYLARAERIHAELAGADVQTLLRKQDYSSVLWSYRQPAGLSYERLHDWLKRAGFVIYAGQGDLAGRVFRIAHMGDIGEPDLERLCAALAAVLPDRS